ncbi:VOC family protein [Metabacillus litoralis]|uniref:VOC family protein n=1 Tax=Metabacillus litoralis TaxID=152268 RepID=A0A5C6W5S4_9BACI|nr:VOC family protein [Metabacillus litoralis]
MKLLFHGTHTTNVNHIHLKVSQLSKSISFYKEKLGFNVLKQTKHIAHLSTNGKDILITLEEVESTIPLSHNKTGLYHIALLFPSRKELANCLNHLLLTKYPLQGASDHLVSEAIYLADPDGNGIELYVDRPTDTWTKNNNTIEMATNHLDVQDLLAQKCDIPFIKLSPETIIGHIHLQVANIADSERFYQLLGFNIVNRYGNQALFMSTGGYHHHIGLNTWHSKDASPSNADEIGLKSFTIMYPNEETRKAVIAQLKMHNINTHNQDSNYTVKDPSDNLILLSI